ncbi:MAG: hypothetical protein LBM71_04815, partial [Elusimicrobiota bacterium]|nr:hypothetical protein [Elusimicrobiota bacterium]
MQEYIQEYIKQIKSIDVNNANEHSYRTALENLVNALQFKTKHTTAIQEAKDDNLEIEGTPDFFVYEDYDKLFKSLIGFIECKKISRDLADVLQSEQVKKYSKTTSNIIITNYRDFVLLQEGKTKAKATLIDKDLSINKNPNKEQDFINLLRDFYNYDYAFIKTKKTLVAALASQSFYYSVALREYILNPQNSNDAFYDKFKNLFQEFQKTISYNYQLEDFCDIYAQSLVYGLLLARLETDEKFDEKSFNFLDNIPEEYSLLYEFLETGFSKRNLPVQIKVALTNI